MKDLVIKGKWIKRELIVLTVLFLSAVIINVIGIVKHDTRWIEMLSQLHVVFILTLLLYALLWLVRLIIFVVILPFRKKNK
ncbi:MAG: hypothetical protein JW965_09435 [Bacteroidales bacterium]|nr:hypothetical protein [Bacteroidales bacterium]